MNGILIVWICVEMSSRTLEKGAVMRELQVQLFKFHTEPGISIMDKLKQSEWADDIATVNHWYPWWFREQSNVRQPKDLTERSAYFLFRLTTWPI